VKDPGQGIQPDGDAPIRQSLVPQLPVGRIRSVNTG
jgi:hypothetical protein